MSDDVKMHNFTELPVHELYFILFILVSLMIVDTSVVR